MTDTSTYIISGILNIFLGPLGQLLSRALYLNGSLDKWWLIIVPIFWLPPFSIVPYVAMLLGFIQNGSGVKPFDTNLLVTFLGTMIVPLIFNMFYLNEHIIGSFIETFIILLLILIPMYIREKQNCESDTVKKSADLTRVIFNASIAHLIGTIFKIGLSFVIDYTPIGVIVGALETILPFMADVKEAILYSLGATTAVLGTNMVQATDLNAYCSTDRQLWSAAIMLFTTLSANSAYEWYLSNF